MKPVAAPEPAQPPEQERYATMLDGGSRVGVLLLLLSFAAYVSGLLPGQVPVERLPALWSLPVAEFQAQTQMPTGWGWLALLGHGDMLGLLGIALLAGISIPCLLALVPLYARRGDKAYVGLCLAEVAVVLLAASGLLTGGH
jgi:hypothetical protein